MKKLSQNIKSGIGIRDSKFSASVFTPSGTFIFEKNHILKITFYETLQNHDFWKFGEFWKMQNLDQPLGDPKMG